MQQKKNPHCSRLLIDRGIDYNVTGIYYDEGTLLHAATSSADPPLRMIRKLVEDGADVNAVTKYLETPLMEAASSGNLELVKFLVGKGADVQKKNKFGQTAMFRYYIIETYISFARSTKILMFL